jgi:hypothetical protein
LIHIGKFLPRPTINVEKLSIFCNPAPARSQALHFSF